MDSISPDIKNVDKNPQKPELNPEERIVSSYFQDRSEVYRDLLQVQDDVSG